MISRIGLKLAAGFLLVALVSMGTVAILAQRAVTNQFTQYVEHAAGMNERMGQMNQGMGRMMAQMMMGTQEQVYLQSVDSSLWTAGLIAGGVAVLLSLFVARQITLPLRGMTHAAERIARGDLGQRVEVKGSDELAHLAAAFNTMAESLSHHEQVRKHLVADIAHELRTPLSVIQGEMEAMLDGVVEATPARLKSVHEEAVLLARLVSDLRELSLAEAGQLQLSRTATDLHGLLRRAAERVQPAAEQQSVGLTVKAPNDLPPALVDPDRISQVLHNLLSNALRYTHAGGSITLGLDWRAGEPEGGPRGEGGGKVREPSRMASVFHLPRTSPTAAAPVFLVSVADTGDGIAPQDLPRVFDRFYRVDKSRARSSGGSGIGLAIVKQLVEAHGGQVGVESTPGQGSCFYFTLPASSTRS